MTLSEENAMLKKSLEEISHFMTSLAEAKKIAAHALSKCGDNDSYNAIQQDCNFILLPVVNIADTLSS